MIEPLTVVQFRRHRGPHLMRKVRGCIADHDWGVMQQVLWIPTTTISWLAHDIPAWMGMWFAVFPTTETLIAQLLAAILVIGSYFLARHQTVRGSRRDGIAAQSSENAPVDEQVGCTCWIFSKGKKLKIDQGLFHCVHTQAA